MKPKLINYIKKQKKSCFSFKQIKDALFKAGHDITTVEEHLRPCL
ncbi:MAG: hypothetical protein ACFFG0_32200 [Candidatus Thorarchaeota archaeon]